jgi:uncharacterized protein (DUF849 family)
MCPDAAHDKSQDGQRNACALEAVSELLRLLTSANQTASAIGRERARRPALGGDRPAGGPGDAGVCGQQLSLLGRSAEIWGKAVPLMIQTLTVANGRPKDGIAEPSTARDEIRSVMRELTEVPGQESRRLQAELKQIVLGHPPFSKSKDGSELYQNSPVTWTTLATKIRELGMKPVPILWDIGSVRGTQALVEMGLLAPPLFCEVALTEAGQLCGHPGTMKGLQAHLDFFPGDGWLWTVLVWGASLLPMAEAVIRKGGHISIGLGDYGYPELGSPSNAGLVKQVAQIARSVGRPLATPDQAREMLALK